MNQNWPATPPLVVLFSSDLMLISSAGGAAALAGLAFVSVTTITQLDALAQQRPIIVCLDLSAAEGSPDAIAKVLPAATLRIALAFGPHVHTAKLDAARQAGFTRVLSRGQFVSKLREEISEAADRMGTES